MDASTASGIFSGALMWTPPTIARKTIVGKVDLGRPNSIYFCASIAARRANFRVAFASSSSILRSIACLRRSSRLRGDATFWPLLDSRGILCRATSRVGQLVAFIPVRMVVVSLNVTTPARIYRASVVTDRVFCFVAHGLSTVLTVIVSALRASPLDSGHSRTSSPCGDCPNVAHIGPLDFGVDRAHFGRSVGRVYTFEATFPSAEQANVLGRIDKTPHAVCAPTTLVGVALSGYVGDRYRVAASNRLELGYCRRYATTTYRLTMRNHWRLSKLGEM